MKSIVAVYNSNEEALNATKTLKDENFNMGLVSIVGKADLIEDHLHINHFKEIESTPALVGVGAGITVGILTGLGIFAIPGFGFLYGAGVVVGAIGGFDLGLIAGGIGAVLTSLGLDKDKVMKYEEHLKDGKFMVLINGADADVETAKSILHTEGTHFELS